MISTLTHILQQIKNSCYRITGYTSEKHNAFVNPVFVGIAIGGLALLLFAYGNHFSNTFHFDDSHTIENNGAIQEVNIIRFFKDATTFSTLPANQTYRPYTVSENAIDYAIAKGLHPKIFHIHIFITFVILCICICVMVKTLLDRVHFSNYNQFWGLSVALLFGTLCANAETVNYIIQRAEISAALYVVLGLLAYSKGGFWKKSYLYLLFPCIGFFAKEMTLVFAPILLLYIVLIEKQVYLLHVYKKEEFKKCLQAFIQALPAFVISILFYIFHANMLPDTLALSHLNRYEYLITQPAVICHYFITYFVPYNLSVDTDWKVFTSILDYRALLGILGLGILIYMGLRASKSAETRLISFGLLWFLIALLPTSSFIPLSEVLNDHRAFIPYIGLTIAFVFSVIYLWKTYVPSIQLQNNYTVIVIFTLMLFSIGNSYGVRQRNIVWKTELSLWKDAATKSPKNGRGLMNYGITLMENKEYGNAEIYFKKALELNPKYSIIYINLGILKNATGHFTDSENFFKKAIELTPSSYSAWYHYGNFLVNQKRLPEAQNAYSKVLEVSPNHLYSALALLDIYHTQEDWESLQNEVTRTLSRFPKHPKLLTYQTITKEHKSKLALLEEDIEQNPSPNKYIDLSLQYFQRYQYQKTITSAQKALRLQEDSPQAYNNIGIAYFKLGKYDQAMKAYEKALNLTPDYQLVKNNYNEVKKVIQIEKGTSLETKFLKTSDDFLNFSLECYNAKRFNACIEAAKKSIAIQPNVIAYNNICAAYNQLHLFDQAISACNQALALDPNHTLAKGNLNHAHTLKHKK